MPPLAVENILKMTLLEKVNNSLNTQAFTMYKEGLFYKCYNEDAMVFSQQVKNYKVNAKFVKSVGAEVLSLGFPMSEVKNGNLSLDVIKIAINAASYKEEAETVVFYIHENIKANYQKYQEALANAKELVVAEKQSEYNYTNRQILVKMIQEFDLANSTPMQGLVFIQELKNNIKTQG